ncbi:MAG: thioredoxin domain-containing protein, partial [bacterium]
MSHVDRAVAGVLLALGALVSADAAPRHTNRLAKEKSPYLLQHAHNPVDWYPWGPEALAKAQREDKPIFLSIGYSTCHWCHVMEKESFENEDIARVMNEHFVSIKVDREERPDLDHLYMTAVMAMTGQGGWPMSTFLTPDGRPFYGGTYFPPDDRYGRPGFKRVLLTLADAWKNKRDDLLATAGELTRILHDVSRSTTTGGGAALDASTLKTAFESLQDSFDERDGGFGGAPKFPRPHALTFLLRYHARAGEASALKMAEVTLDRMAGGGIHDQIGGGFHRYSTDEKWLVPHFEKMLYDQALLARAYLEAHQVTRTRRGGLQAAQEYARVARRIFEYVMRDLTDSAGGFYSAEDADSEGVEGKFYVWTPAELERTLGPVDGKRAAKFFGVTQAGNFEHGWSILHLPKPVTGLDRAWLDGVSRKLLEARSTRIRPHRDDKVLASWNGLMISALAYGAQVLDDPRYSAAAAKAAEFVLTKMRRPDGRLLRRYRAGEAAVPGFLDDYAFMALGLLDLYEATFDPR